MSGDQMIRADERTALITAIGIILGFALTFFTAWSLKDAAPEIPVVLVTQDKDVAIALKDYLENKRSKFPNWDNQDLIPLGGLLLGIGFLMWSLYRSLKLEQIRKFYNCTVKIFMAGILIVLISSVASLFL